MTRQEMTEKIAERTGMTKIEVDVVIKGVFELLGETLSENRRAEFRGFGSFNVKRRAPKSARNPGTNEIVHVPERFVPVFKPSDKLKIKVNESIKKRRF